MRPVIVYNDRLSVVYLQLVIGSPIALWLFMPLMPMTIFDDDEDDDKNRLFETHQRSSRSLGQYLKILLIVAAGIVVVGGTAFYLTLPGIGDKVKAPAGLEYRVRDHLLTKEKRTATDLTVYNCGTFYWVIADVETRPDIPGSPINQISRFRLTSIQSGSDWDITSAPLSGNDQPTPCS